MYTNQFDMNEPSPDVLFDTENLRINANYEVEVFEDVYWVPVNQLGGTRYTNSMINEMLILTPEEKQQRFSTLYEAIQLYQASNFRGVFDNYEYGGWFFHKPGYHAVRTNEGCCAADANWLSYILYGKYEQMGFLHYLQRDSNGHIINYIFSNGWYYFIDMMTYRSDSLPYAGKEVGTKDGYKNGTLISGNLHKSRSPQSYVNYCLTQHKDTPVLFLILLQKEVFGVGLEYKVNPLQSLDDATENGYNIFFSPTSNVFTLYAEKNSKIRLEIKEAPKCSPKWQEIPTESFS